MSCVPESKSHHRTLSADFFLSENAERTKIINLTLSCNLLNCWVKPKYFLQCCSCWWTSHVTFRYTIYELHIVIIFPIYNCNSKLYILLFQFITHMEPGTLTEPINALITITSLLSYLSIIWGIWVQFGGFNGVIMLSCGVNEICRLLIY